MKIALFADIHANLTALKAVLDHCKKKYGSRIPIIHLGDCIDYGMRPNEVIKLLSSYKKQMLINIKGNHEAALLGNELHRFSSERGYQANLYTKSVLTSKSYDFIHHMKDGFDELIIGDKKIVAVHGDLNDIYWGKMSDLEKTSPHYISYTYVISGHTHISSLSYIINKDKHYKTIFINPGSIGQPRNYNPNAQYAILDTDLDAIYFETIPYDYKYEQSLYTEDIDSYYKERLSKGI